MEMCGAVMCEECGGWVCCVLVLQTMPCSQHCTHCVNQHCISLYVLYSARNIGPPTAYWGWTSTWVGGAGDGVEVNIGGYGVVDE